MSFTGNIATCFARQSVGPLFSHLSSLPVAATQPLRSELLPAPRARTRNEHSGRGSSGHGRDRERGKPWAGVCAANGHLKFLPSPLSARSCLPARRMHADGDGFGAVFPLVASSTGTHRSASGGGFLDKQLGVMIDGSCCRRESISYQRVRRQQQ